MTQRVNETRYVGKTLKRRRIQEEYKYILGVRKPQTGARMDG